MKLKSITLFLLANLLINMALIAQKPYWDEYFSDNIETVQLTPPGEPLGDPFLVLNDKNSKLHLSFDMFGTEYQSLEYTLIHCDADWFASDLLPNEYLDGYTEAYINDYEYSINTKQPYIHYKANLPKSDMMITKSGNYILKVYPEDEDDKPLFIKRFMVIDSRATVGGKVNRTSDPSIRKTHQEVDFQVNITYLGSQFPSKELRVFVRQNQRWDNIKKDLQPLSISNGVMDFDLDKENVFPGLNTFRYFDFSSQRYNSEYLDRIDVSGAIDEVYLLPSQIRRGQEYVEDPDFHGVYFIETKDWANSRVEAEYSDVHFSMAYNVPLLDGEVYVLGELTNWNITPYNKMTYNYEKKAYETTLFLKQGYYSYMYAFLPTDAKTADVAFFEGSHYQTQNFYYVFVYFRAPGTTYDQLVGMTLFRDYSI
ncbi:DUF5103 domain-containing protein [Lentimicrobium sp. L6]|uniref:type IX secretion system plug protein n=1 Tax=Lentimicrobium sp. L6 TaxID=2735916 RepID=UPI00155312CA|nr:DUF5103 domain-containing protein [Lentimicrobium sp. L6]NPD86269.1 DUF5103 domain-containing protein [Lentimicrobium sp. L6]